LRFLVDHGDEARDGITKTSRCGGESWRTVCVRPMWFPVSPLLVQVLFPDARAPFAGFLIECGSDLKGAVSCGIVRGMTDSEEDVPIWGMPDLRAYHPASVQQWRWSHHRVTPPGPPPASTVAATNPTAAAKQAAGSAAGANQ
jgi:hypothetical protein